MLLVPGAGVIVENSSGQVLLLKRRDTPQWCTPGGSAEEGSSFSEAALAELEEETGLRATEADLIPFATVSKADIHTIRYPNGDLVHAFSVWFAVRRWSGSPRIDPEESVQMGWFDRSRLPEPMFKPSAAALELYGQFLRTGQFQVS